MSSPRSDGRLTPTDVQQVEFRLSFRGYNERDVDAFLDRITEDLDAYIEENDRLRSAPATAAEGLDGEVLASARREADEIVARAREQAASILREAETSRFVSQAGSVDARAAVAPFLSHEREFLQSLGALVQSHAEEIKGMVLALRAKVEQAPIEGPSTTAVSDDAEEPEDRPDGGMVALPEASEEDVGATQADGEPASSAEDGEDVIASEPAAARRDSGERSLRDLFWGED